MKYITLDELKAKGINITDEYLIEECSRNIDILTYNRIVKIGFDNLTIYQKETIKNALAILIRFNVENKELINSILSGYSINGVSMSFDINKFNLYHSNGVLIPKNAYDMLESTGLCVQKIF